MTDIIRIPSDLGGTLAVEVGPPIGTSPTPGGVVKVGRPSEVVGTAAKTLEEALDAVVPGATTVLERLKSAKPQAIDLTFGIRLTAEAGAVIAKTAAECNFAVTLHWTEGR